MAYALLRGGSLSKSPLEEAEVGGHMIKLVLCDMDGTLVPFGAERVSDRTLSAIRSLVHAGVRFGPASGREPIDLKTFFFKGTACLCTRIVELGCLTDNDRA